MHELGLRTCEGGPWLTEGAWNEHYALLRRTLKSVVDDAVATIEESSEDTSSYISVQINEQQISVDEPEWQTIQPNNTHKNNKKRMTVKTRK